MLRAKLRWNDLWHKHRQLRHEPLEERVVLDAAMLSIVGQTAQSWLTYNDFRFAGGTLKGSNPSEGWPVTAFADFTDDGITDVLVKDVAGEWQLHVNDGRQLFATPWGNEVAVALSVDDEPALPSIPDTASLVDVADFDANGRPDVAMYDQASGEVWIGVGKENHVENQRWETLPAGIAEDRVFVGDFSGDQAADVLVGVDGGRWTLARSTSTLDGLGSSNWGSFPDYAWEHLVAGDFDGDDIDDIAAMAPDKTWWVWSGGSEGFGAAQYFGHWNMRDAWHDLGVADFDNDGRDDIIGRSGEGELFVGSATAENEFHTWRWGTGWVHQANWSSITHVDFNEDGLIDQVGHAQDGTWWYAENQGAKFRNRYITSTQGFSDASNWYVLPNFSRDQSVSVSSFVEIEPESESSADTQDDTDSVTQPPREPHPYDRVDPHYNDLITVTLDEENRIVLLGPEINLLGVDVQSSGGYLTPVEGSSLPFDFFLANTTNQVTFGNLGRLQLLEDERLVLPVKWDSSGGVHDLLVQWGGTISADDSGPEGRGRAFLDDSLVAIIDPESLAPDEEEVEAAEVPIESDSAPNIPFPALMVSEEGLLQLHSIGRDVIGVEIRSRSGSLTPIASDTTTPFDTIIENTERRVVLANVFDPIRGADRQRMNLPISWDSGAGANDLQVTLYQRVSNPHLPVLRV